MIFGDYVTSRPSSSRRLEKKRRRGERGGGRGRGISHAPGGRVPKEEDPPVDRHGDPRRAPAHLCGARAGEPYQRKKKKKKKRSERRDDPAGEPRLRAREKEKKKRKKKRELGGQRAARPTRGGGGAVPRPAEEEGDQGGGEEKGEGSAYCARKERGKKEKGKEGFPRTQLPEKKKELALSSFLIISDNGKREKEGGDLSILIHSLLVAALLDYKGDQRKRKRRNPRRS